MSITWTPVCHLSQIARESGVAAWVHGEAVAVFRDHTDAVYALSNIDPKTGASVLSRGIVGTRRRVEGDVGFVASPLLKQPYRLSDGVCLDDETLKVATYEVRVVGGSIEVGARRD
ncbi:nitrite reductase small subunit NirD [Nocardioides acrostichi]|uniref:Nitrite reductase small subunit NirD n=1 Tax=Nocardioides acrostichi TaxID=2784339 RepID=A0A930YE80_9ACTN|nr:nitrite reductase small subunit NirD [Nocardioides acrostichi]MBF4163239.1 nitrite reductase small subunit NirD [Nocardioides acrostichi]